MSQVLRKEAMSYHRALSSYHRHLPRPPLLPLPLLLPSILLLVVLALPLLDLLLPPRLKYWQPPAYMKSNSRSTRVA